VVYLKGDFQLISRRLAGRAGHFMNPELLPSQFATLEEPGQEALVLDAALTPEELVNRIRQALGI